MSKIVTPIILLSVLLLAPRIINAQDIIQTKSGEQIKARILEIYETEIKYQQYSNPDGPAYYIKKSEIAKVIYGSGETAVFNQTTGEAGKEIVEYSENIMWYHLFDLLFQDFTVSYERILKNENYSIQIPIGVGLGPSQITYEPAYNLIYSGFGINVYPFGQGLFKYFFGSSIIAGYGEGLNDYWDWGISIDDQELKEVVYGKFLVNNGIIVNPSKHYAISAVFGVGVKYLDSELYYHPEDLSRSGYFSIRMGYRF